MSKKNCEEIMSYGIDAMTGGNHSWDKREIFNLFNSYPIVRPVNYPDNSPGRGVLEVKILDKRVAIVSVMGHYTMPMADNPFIKINEVVTKLKEDGIKHNYSRYTCRSN
jgi:calcineurin-like phosphoesterase